MNIQSVSFVQLREICSSAEMEEEIREKLSNYFTYGDCSYSLVHRREISDCLDRPKFSSVMGYGNNVLSQFREILANLSVDYIAF